MPASATQNPNAKTCKETIIQRLGQNETLQSIARDYQVSHQRISEIKQANLQKVEEIRQRIISENIERLQTIVNNDIQTVEKISAKAKKNIEDLTDNEKEYKKNTKTHENLLRSVGIYPSHNPSLILQFNQDNRQNTIITQDIRDFLRFKSDQNGEYQAEIVENVPANGEINSDNAP